MLLFLGVFLSFCASGRGSAAQGFENVSSQRAAMRQLEEESDVHVCMKNWRPGINNWKAGCQGCLSAGDRQYCNEVLDWSACDAFGSYKIQSGIEVCSKIVNLGSLSPVHCSARLLLTDGEGGAASSKGVRIELHKGRKVKYTDGSDLGELVKISCVTQDGLTNFQETGITTKSTNYDTCKANPEDDEVECDKFFCSKFSCKVPNAQFNVDPSCKPLKTFSDPAIDMATLKQRIETQFLSGSVHEVDATGEPPSFFYQVGVVDCQVFSRSLLSLATGCIKVTTAQDEKQFILEQFLAHYWPYALVLCCCICACCVGACYWWKKGSNTKRGFCVNSESEDGDSGSDGGDEDDEDE